MNIKLKRAPGIYLTGFMGAGKTTIARALAERLGWEFVDLDAEIAAQEGAEITEIFDTRGEDAFRRIEREAVKTWVHRVGRGMPSVIALGGGTFAQPENLDLLENHGISIWLDCPIEILRARVAADAGTRPLARDRASFERLYEERRAGYSRASYRIDASCDVDGALERILELPIWK